MTGKHEIASSAKSSIGEQLSQLLADSFVLYVKTQNFHWNLIDPRFYSLHKMFQDQYEELATAIDDIAERIRGLSILSPGSMKAFLSLASLQEASNDLSGDQMIESLLQDHEAICRQIRPRIESMQKAGDEGSADFLIERLRVHEKTAWMLRSHKHA